MDTHALVLDDILQQLAVDEHQVPVFGYPRNDDVNAYEHFTGKELSTLVDGAVWELLALGLKPSTGAVVALFAPSDLDFVVSMLALSRLGYAALTISLRLPVESVEQITRSADSVFLLHGTPPSIASTAKQVAAALGLPAHPLPTRAQYDHPDSPTLTFTPQYDREVHNGVTAVILHSSGTTGAPKPLPLSHRALLANASLTMRLHNLVTLPLYHMHGICSFYQALLVRKMCRLLPASRPVTPDLLVQSLEATRPEVVHSVPYIVELVAENEAGVQALERCKVVTTAGARMPDHLGNMLVAKGVNISVFFGSTEGGCLGHSAFRPPGDNAWDYIRIFEAVRPYVVMDPIEDTDGLYELTYLPTFPALASSKRSNTPVPGSWRSGDLFQPHPTIPDAWKPISRLDDRLTLVNGEKITPLASEALVRGHPFVREAIMAGTGRAIPSLLVFRAPEADHLREADYLDAIWPSIQEANSRAEAYAQIARDMVAIIRSGVKYPQTDKGNAIRTKIYNQFAREIDALYAAGGADDGAAPPAPGVPSNLPQLQQLVLDVARAETGIFLPAISADFYAHGVDSLKAIQLRRVLLRSLGIDSSAVGQNVVYDAGTPRRLAAILWRAKGGEEVWEAADDDELIKEMEEKYAKFDLFKPSPPPTDSRSSVILTGATGSLGSHVLARLLPDPSIKTVYCFSRGRNPILSLLSSLDNRELDLQSSSYWSKVIVLSTDLEAPDFGLPASTIETLRRDVNLIVHAAWPVNFALGLSSFAPSVSGIANLVRFSLSVTRSAPARLLFCSSVSVALAGDWTPEKLVPSAPLADSTVCLPSGYARSKFVGEKIVYAGRAAGGRCAVLRIGQVVGDTMAGVWNVSEAIPLVVRSALAMGVLPELDETCSWIPVDTLAATVVDLAGTLSPSHDSKALCYNIQSPHIFHWSTFLTSLRAAGLSFKFVPALTWIRKLRESAAKGEEDTNPAVRLLGHYEEMYGQVNGQVNGEAGGSDQGKSVNMTCFDIGPALRDSKVLRESAAPVGDHGDLAGKFLGSWMRRWKRDE